MSGPYSSHIQFLVNLSHLYTWIFFLVFHSKSSYLIKILKGRLYTFSSYKTRFIILHCDGRAINKLCTYFKKIVDFQSCLIKNSLFLQHFKVCNYLLLVQCYRFVRLTFTVNKLILFYYSNNQSDVEIFRY